MHGDLDNTLLMFLSDNGACAEWEPFGFDLTPVADPQPGVGINLGTQAAPNLLRTGTGLSQIGGPGSMISYGSAWANASNTPWRSYKHYCYEGGISTPLIVHWPARISARGELRAQVGHLIDILPTCLEVGKGNYPAELAGHPISPPEGRSLVPVFENKALARAYLAFEHEGNAAIRAGDWKAVRKGASGSWELYDIARDRSELHDLAAQQPQRVKELAAQWQAWAERTHVFPKPGGEAKK
jgi:arylsulfatase